MEAKMSISSLHLFSFLLLLLLLMMSTMPSISAATTSKSTYKNFIKTACNSTRYPNDCIKALSPYASAIKTDPQKLCNVALSITLNATLNTSSSIQSLSKMKGLSPSDREVIGECAETVGDAIDELASSLKAIAAADLQGSNRMLQISNVKTWVSAALTNEYTCTDEFVVTKVSNAVKNTIKKSVLNLAKMASNCLALFNYLH